MSTLLDEETLLLESLDVVSPCEWRRSLGHSAEVAMLCRGCRASVLLCRKHVEKVRAVLDKARIIGCTRCDRESRSFYEAVEVVDL